MTTTSKPADLETVLRITREIVEEKGDSYIYDPPPRYGYHSCWYADADGNPSCLVGHVIQRLDPEAFQRVVEYEELWHHSDSPRALANRVNIGGIMTPDGWQAMSVAQRVQDSGCSWSEALYEAENMGADAD